MTMGESELEYSSSSPGDNIAFSKRVEEDTEIVRDEITSYEGEPFASSDDDGDDHEEEDEGDKDGLTPASLEWRIDKTEPLCSLYAYFYFFKRQAISQFG